LDEAHRLPLLGPAIHTRRALAASAPPAFILLEARSPSGVGRSPRHQSPSRRLFFFRDRGSGEVIHRLALRQRTPRRRPRAARMLSPRTRFPIKPSSKLTSAAIASVQRLCPPCRTPSQSGAASPLGPRLPPRRRRPGFSPGTRKDSARRRASRPRSLRSRG
jgi:hypothetical protein